MTKVPAGKLDLAMAVAVIRDERSKLQREADDQLMSAKGLISDLQHGLIHPNFAGKFETVSHVNTGGFALRDSKRETVLEVNPATNGSIEVKPYGGEPLILSDHNAAMRAIATLLIEKQLV